MLPEIQLTIALQAIQHWPRRRARQAACRNSACTALAGACGRPGPIASLDGRAVRLPVLWERVETRHGEFDFTPPLQDALQRHFEHLGAIAAPTEIRA